MQLRDYDSSRQARRGGVLYGPRGRRRGVGSAHGDFFTDEDFHILALPQIRCLLYFKMM